MAHRPARQRDAKASREAILDAAMEQFGRHGFDGTTFAHICQAAGVSRGLPNYLFANKRKLYRAVIERAAGDLRGRMLDALRSVPPAASPEIVLDRFVATYVDYLAANRTVVRLLQFEMLGSTGHAALGVGGSLFVEGLGLLRSTFKSVRIADAEARHALLSIVALCFCPFMLNGLGFDVSPFQQAFVTARKRHVVRLLLRGIGR